MPTDVKSNSENIDKSLNVYRPLMIKLCKEVEYAINSVRVSPKYITEYAATLWEKKYGDKYRIYHLGRVLLIFVDKDVAIKFDFMSNPQFIVIGISEELISLNSTDGSKVVIF